MLNPRITPLHWRSFALTRHSMVDEKTEKTLFEVARFYDRKKVGDVGFLGFRRSTDLSKLAACLSTMIEQRLLVPEKTLFLDMGCADGRVNVLLSYVVQQSIGIELDEWTLEEYRALRSDLEAELKRCALPLPPDNIHLFHGDTMDGSLHDLVQRKTGVRFEHYDLFYTYLTMQEEFAALISQGAKRGAVFMVYGLEKILPRFDGLHLLTDTPLQGILALYQKP
jgi:hypothetical protein